MIVMNGVRGAPYLAALVLSIAVAFFAVAPVGQLYQSLNGGRAVGLAMHSTLAWAQHAALLVALFFAACVWFERLRDLVFSRIGVFCAPFVFLALFIWYKVTCGYENPVYLRLVKEDNLVEYVTSLSFLLACPFAFVAASKLFKRGLWPAGILIVLFACLTLFFGLEEISYGQRIFGFATPGGLAIRNTQQEFNIHNLAIVRDLNDRLGPILLVAWGLVGWILALLSNLLPWKASIWGRSFVIAVPPWYVASYFLPYALWHVSGPEAWLLSGVVWQDQEPAEMFLAFALLLYSLSVLRTAGNSETSN